MDERLESHAEIIVDYCTEVKSGNDVLISAPKAAEDLVVAVYDRLGAVGATPRLHWHLPRARRAYHKAMDVEDYRTGDHHLAEMKAADAVIMILGENNTYETSDVDSAKKAASRRSDGPVLEAQQKKRWVLTQYPTTANAQEAEMSTSAYEDFVWSAIDKDWEEQGKRQEKVAEILEAGEEVRIVSGDTTDISMSIESMLSGNDDGKFNMPGGEVFTAPVPDSVEGEVLFDEPVRIDGTYIHDVFLKFEEGRVTEFDSRHHTDTLRAHLDTDDGARRLGEFGIGMNEDITRFTKNTFFDEKMGGTIHLAIGNAIPQTVPEGVDANESAEHIDMIVDMNGESYIQIDDTVVQRNGEFMFEA